MTALVESIALLLEGNGVGDYAPPGQLLDPAKTPIGVGSLPATPDTALAVTLYPGGPEPDSRNGWQYPRLQVRVRALNPLDALALDQQAYDVLQGHGPADLPGATWFLQDCHAVNSEAAPIGTDDNGRTEYVRNYQLTCWTV